MKNIVFVFSCMFPGVALTQSQTYAWSAGFGADSSDYSSAVTSDAFGNVYTTGACAGAVDFDPGPGTYTLGPAQGSINPWVPNIYISKMDAAGNLLWARRMGDTLAFVFGNWGISISADAAGNVITSGFFSGTVDFDPGPAIYNLSSLSPFARSIFILKLDANGNFIWAKKLDGGYSGQTVSATLDPSGSFYATGFFQGNIDMDPGPAVVSFTTPVSLDNAFILKLDAQGNFVFAKQLRTTGINSYGVYGWGIGLDVSGNIYVNGGFGGTADFDGGPATYTLTATNTSHYVLKLDGAGSLLWAKQFGANSIWSEYATIYAGNDLYLTGQFNGSVDFDPGPAIYSLTATGTSSNQTPYNQFILKLDLSGNFLWAKSLGSTDYSSGVDLAVDAASCVYVAGGFEGSADFDPGPGVFSITGNGGSDCFILKLDPSGNFVWAGTTGGPLNDWVGGMALGTNGDIFMSGSYQSSCDFDPGPSVTNLTSAGKDDIFILKWSQCTTAYPPLDLTPSQSKLICENNMASLSAFALNPVSWFDSPGSSISLGTGTSYISPPLQAGNYTFYAADATCNTLARTAISVSVDVCTGFPSLDKKRLYWCVLPNPSPDGFLTIDIHSPEENMKLSVLNATGQQILDNQVLSGTLQLDLSSYTPGIYFIRLSGKHGSFPIQKIIKQ